MALCSTWWKINRRSHQGSQITATVASACEPITRYEMAFFQMVKSGKALHPETYKGAPPTPSKHTSLRSESLTNHFSPQDSLIQTPGPSPRELKPFFLPQFIVFSMLRSTASTGVITGASWGAACLPFTYPGGCMGDVAYHDNVTFGTATTEMHGVLSS